MKPARFDYARAESLDEVHDVLAAEGDEARIIAGGQSLLPMLSMRLARPTVLVDIMHLPALATIADAGKSIRIGAAVRQAQVLAWPKLRERAPLLAAALPWVGHAQTRARGTVCGSIAHADPSAEIPLTMVALGAQIELSSKRGKRCVAAADFFTGLMTTERAVDEMIEAVEVPAPASGQGFAFREYGRRHGDFAIIACAAVADAKETRLAIGGVGDRATVREFAQTGSALDEALAEFSEAVEMPDDLHASAEYRRTVMRGLGRQAVEEARRCRA